MLLDALQDLLALSSAPEQQHHAFEHCYGHILDAVQVWYACGCACACV